jgi:hypothetical protein
MAKDCPVNERYPPAPPPPDEASKEKVLEPPPPAPPATTRKSASKLGRKVTVSDVVEVAVTV